MKQEPDKGYREMTPTFLPTLRLRRWRQVLPTVAGVVASTLVFLALIMWPLIAMMYR